MDLDFCAKNLDTLIHKKEKKKKSVVVCGNIVVNGKTDFVVVILW